MIDPGRVACYIRWSTDEQGDGTTLAIQRESCQHFLQSQGWRWDEARCYVDDGYSGGTLERPSLSRLRQAVSQGQIDCVVVYKLDRLSRSVLHTVKLVMEEWEGRCYIKSTREPVDTTSPAGKMFFYMLVSYAEWERSLIRERTMAGKRQRASQGRNPGIRFPYGYRRGERTGDFAIADGAAAVVRRIFDEYAAGRGILAIANALNDDGVPTPRDGRWRASTVRYLLGNEAYRGLLRYGRHCRVEQALPAIVPDEMWNAVQHRLGERTHVRKGPEGYLLSGLARCRCGAPLVGGRSAGRYRHYFCSARRSQGTAICAARAIPADPFEAAVTEAVLATLPVLTGSAVVAAMEAECRARLRIVRTTEERWRGELEVAQRTADRLHGDYAAHRLVAELYGERWTELHERMDAIGRERDAARERRLAAARALQAVRRGAERIGTCAPDAREGWARLQFPEQKELLRCVALSLTAWALPGKPGGVDVQITLPGQAPPHA